MARGVCYCRALGGAVSYERGTAAGGQVWFPATTRGLGAVSAKQWTPETLIMGSKDPIEWGCNAGPRRGCSCGAGAAGWMAGSMVEDTRKGPFWRPPFSPSLLPSPASTRLISFQAPLFPLGGLRRFWDPHHPHGV
jgi:hypothetical protein